MFWPSSREGVNWTLENFCKLFGEWIIFMKTTQEDMLSKQQRFSKQFQHNINQPDTINCNQKTVLEYTVYCKSSSWKVESRNQRIRSTSNL